MKKSDLISLLNSIKGNPEVKLKEQGSLAVPGWMRPEGAVMLEQDTDTRFKIIIDK